MRKSIKCAICKTKVKDGEGYTGHQGKLSHCRCIK